MLQRRHAEREKDEKSIEIGKKVISLPDFLSAKTIAFYFHTEAEVRTQELIEKALQLQKDVALPYCLGKEMRFVRILSLDELNHGRFRILEPKEKLRNDPTRQCPFRSIDLILIPGVAFDRRGNRLGRGQGFYDRLLAEVRAETKAIGLAYECQLVESVPSERHDRPVNMIISERQVYQCENLRTSA